jgi:hypothetical protein
MNVKINLMVITTCFLMIGTSYAQRRSNGNSIYQINANRAAQDKIEIEAAKVAAKKRAAQIKHIQDNPWENDAKWRDLSQRIDTANKQRELKQKEFILLQDAGQKDTPRGKELSLYLINSRVTIIKWGIDKRAIESNYRLNQFYQQNKTN